MKSQERVVQEEREKRVLQALFMRPFLPDSPREPDGDLLGSNTIERNIPNTIPLEDVRIKIKNTKIYSCNKRWKYLVYKMNEIRRTTDAYQNEFCRTLTKFCI